MYIQGMAQQTQIFLLCTGLGFLLGAVYDAVRFIRKIISCSHRAVIAQDVIFSVICVFTSFIFLLCVGDGEMRMYPYLGMILGFSVWYFTLGVPVSFFSEKLSSAMRTFIRSIFSAVIKIFRKTIKKLKKRKNKKPKPLENTVADSV